MCVCVFFSTCLYPITSQKLLKTQNKQFMTNFRLMGEAPTVHPKISWVDLNDLSSSTTLRPESKTVMQTFVHTEILWSWLNRIMPQLHQRCSVPDLPVLFISGCVTFQNFTKLFTKTLRRMRNRDFQFLLTFWTISFPVSSITVHFNGICIIFHSMLGGYKPR